MSTAAEPHMMRNSNFRWLLGGGLVSMLGDQFSMLALMGAPRAVLILLGGTVADRYTPRRVLLMLDQASLALAYAAALALGIAAAFAIPAGTAIPRIAGPETM